MYIDDRFLEKFLERYMDEEKHIDRIEAKMDKAEAEGNMEKYNRLDRRDDKLIAHLDGMTDVLMMLGYEIQYQNHKPVIVKR